MEIVFIVDFFFKSSNAIVLKCKINVIASFTLRNLSLFFSSRHKGLVSLLRALTASPLLHLQLGRLCHKVAYITAIRR